MKINDFIANLINYYYPVSNFIKTALILDLENKKFSEKDFDKLYDWLLHNFSRKWKTTPDIAIIEEAERAINDYAERFGSRDYYLEYGRERRIEFSLEEIEDHVEYKSCNSDAELTFLKLKEKFGSKDKNK